MKKALIAAVAMQLVVSVSGVNAETLQGQQTSVAVNPSVEVDLSTEPRADAGAQSISGGNIFDFSSGASRPPAPGLPSFAGGPCTGPSFGASTSVGGVAVGAGRSSLDESCQRRNWVQTLIGASQHMPPEEAKFLLRVSVEVMRDDPYLAPALERAGLPSVDAEETAIRDDDQAGSKYVSSKTPSCAVLVSKNAPIEVVALIESRGCEVDRGE